MTLFPRYNPDGTVKVGQRVGKKGSLPTEEDLEKREEERGEERKEELII